MRQYTFDITNNNGFRCIERIWAISLEEAKYKLSLIQCVEIYHMIC
jgi:hypothetical protein